MKAAKALLAGVLALCVLNAGSAQAAYPERPVTVIVPYAAGGPMDRLARQLAAKLDPLLGQTVVIVNQAGAGGNIGTLAAKRAAPNGYTLLLDHIHMATAPALYRALGLDPLADFATIGVVAESPLVVVSRAGVPVQDKQALLRWLAGHAPATLANAGVGSASFLCGLLLQKAMNSPMTPVPYRGTGPAMIDLMSGQVDLMCDLSANVIPQVQTGRVQPIAVTVPGPLTGTLLARTPTLKGYGLDMEPLTIWYGLYAPAGTPPGVIRTLSDALQSVARDAAFIEEQHDMGIQVVGGERLTPEGHRHFLREELDRWRKVIEASGYVMD